MGEKSVSSETVDAFDGKETKTDEIFRAGETVSLFASKRLIVIRHAEELRKEEMEKLLAYLPKANPATEFIFLAGKIDKRQGFWQSLMKISRFEEIKPPFRREIPSWVMAEGKRFGLDLSFDTAVSLVGLVGEDLGVLSLSLERLSLSFPEKKKISQEELEVLADISSKTVFDLTDALGQKEVGRCLKLLKKGLAARENFPLLVSMIYRHFKILLNLQELKGKESGEIGKILGIPPYFVKNYQDQSERFSKERCRMVLDLLFQTDRLFKTSSLPAEILAQNFIKGVVL
ncbi:MAG: DNA polymerase III subunit delta [Deltaproteobacteria bacterium]|nr:DNA polymerase III subunit delta [Deltaproteobacteria bacterium]